MEKNANLRFLFGIIVLSIMGLVAYTITVVSSMACDGLLVWKTVVALGAISAIMHFVTAFLKGKVL